MIALKRIVPGFLIICSLSSSAYCQEDSAELRKRISELESDVRRLKGDVTGLRFAMKVQNGVERTVSNDDGAEIQLLIAREGWGQGSPEDVAAVCVSVTETVLRAIRPDEGVIPVVFLIRDKQGPIVLSQRGLNGEYLVMISAGDRSWSQVAYQFSHELGHVLCGDLSLAKPQHWFEEAFCESISLWTMDKMGITWKTNAPYANWNSYAPHLTSYIGDVRDRVSKPDSLPDWYREHQKHLTKEPYDRDKNLILAKLLAAEAHDNNDFYQAFRYLRNGDGEQDDSMEWLLANWIDKCPEQYQFAPKKVAELLNVVPKKQ